MAEDTRDKLEADVRKIAEAYNTDTRRHGTERLERELYHSIMHLLDRQRAITERKTTKRHELFCETCEAESDKRIAELTAERDELKELNDHHALQYELADELYRYKLQCERYEAKINELNSRAERTCRIESSYLNDFTSNHECWYEFKMQCGYQFTWGEMEPPNCCPNCGCKVVGE